MAAVARAGNTEAFVSAALVSAPMAVTAGVMTETATTADAATTFGARGGLANVVTQVEAM